MPVEPIRVISRCFNEAGNVAGAIHAQEQSRQFDGPYPDSRDTIAIMPECASLPLRLATPAGLICSEASLLALGAIQLSSAGMLGEYIGPIHSAVQRRPLALQWERFNSEYHAGIPVAERVEPAGGISLAGYRAAPRNRTEIERAPLERVQRNG